MKYFLILLTLIPSFAMAQNNYQEIEQLVKEISKNVYEVEGYRAGISSTTHINGPSSRRLSISHPKLDVIISVEFNFDRDQKLISIEAGTIENSKSKIDVSKLGEKLDNFYVKALDELEPGKDLSKNTILEYSKTIEELQVKIKNAFAAQIATFVKPDMKTQLSTFLRTWSYTASVIAATSIALFNPHFFENYALLKTLVLGSAILLIPEAHTYLRDSAKSNYEYQRSKSENYKRVYGNIYDFVGRSHGGMRDHCTKVARKLFFTPR